MADYLNPEDIAAQSGIARQQKLAEMLFAQGAQQPQGQMISGQYVKSSPLQFMANLANQYAGMKTGEAADKAQIDLAQKLRNQEMNDLQTYGMIQKGRPESSKELAGPAYQGVAPSMQYPAIEPNPQAANMFAASSYSPALRAMGMKKITEGPSWAEVSQLNPQTGNTDTFVYDKNSSNPKSTMQFVATSKPAITLNERLHLQDKGIAIPNNGGMPTGNAPTADGNPAMVNPSTVNPVQRPVAGNPTIKPVSATGVKENDLVATFGYDPFKPPPPPAGLPSAEAARAYRADQYKPLEGESRKAVNGAANYQDALDRYVQVLNSVDMTDLANPQVRQKIDSAFNTAMLNGKEAYKLGVLNGGDERILTSLLPNYSDTSKMLVFKDTIKDLAQTQKEFGTGIILKEYGSANKPVPEMFRKHIFVPKVEAPANVQPVSFKNENDAAKAGLKKGTRVIINGVAGTWN